MNQLAKAISDGPTLLLAAGSSIVSLFAAGITEDLRYFVLTVLVPSLIAMAAAWGRAAAKSYAETRDRHQAQRDAWEAAREQFEAELARYRAENARLKTAHVDPRTGDDGTGQC